jgi:hypothetical protein
LEVLETFPFNAPRPTDFKRSGWRQALGSSLGVEANLAASRKGLSPNPAKSSKINGLWPPIRCLCTDVLCRCRGCRGFEYTCKVLADEFRLALWGLIPVRKRQPLLLEARLLKNQVNVSLRLIVTVERDMTTRHNSGYGSLVRLTSDNRRGGRRLGPERREDQQLASRAYDGDVEAAVLPLRY